MKRLDEVKLGDLKRGDRFCFKFKYKKKDFTKRPVYQVEMLQYDMFIKDTISQVIIYRDKNTKNPEMEKYDPDTTVIFLRSINN